ncbi:MAG: hypothetical protein FGM24_02230 [Candidatus Kapabacteria bacterium]|nr:hypothetical protein [Candidatus Kapabacteria bacterium]
MSPMNRLLICFCALLCVTSVTAFAQDDEETSKLPTRRQAYIDPVVSNSEILSLGLHGGFGSTSHSGAFKGAPNVLSCCPEFSSGSGSGIVFGLDVSLPLTEKLRFLGRINLQGLGGAFEASESTTVRIGNQAVETSFLHTFDASLSMIALEPAVEYRLGGLGIVAGLRVGILSGGTYKQVDELSDKSIPYTFPNGQQVFQNATGDLTDLSSMQIGALAGLRYHVGLSNNLSVVPEVMFAPNFTALNADRDWGVSSLRFGASVVLTLWGKNVIASPVMPK